MDIEKINVGGTQYDVYDTVARAAISDEFSTGATYAAGDYCIYENTLYKFTAAKAPGAWDASKVTATQIGDELSQLNGKIKSYNLSIYEIQSIGTGTLSCPWDEYMFMAISIGNYGNYQQTVLVLSDFFAGSTSSRRVILTYGNMEVSIYQNGSGSATISVSGTFVSGVQIKMLCFLKS